jgi:hypothetical protein
MMMSVAMEWPSKAIWPAWQGARGCNHAARLGYQKGCRAIRRSHVSRHRGRISAVALEIEGQNPIARLRQIQGIGLHDLPRSGKAMRDDDNRAILVRPLVKRHRRGPCVEVRDKQPDALAFKLKHRQSHKRQRKDRHDQRLAGWGHAMRSRRDLSSHNHRSYAPRPQADQRSVPLGRKPAVAGDFCRQHLHTPVLRKTTPTTRVEIPRHRH